jgi:hypothetical protein
MDAQSASACSLKQADLQPFGNQNDIHPYVAKYLPPSKLYGKRVLVPFSAQNAELAYFQTHASQVTVYCIPPPLG